MKLYILFKAFDCSFGAVKLRKVIAKARSDQGYYCLNVIDGFPNKNQDIL